MIAPLDCALLLVVNEETEVGRWIKLLVRLCVKVHARIEAAVKLGRAKNAAEAKRVLCSSGECGVIKHIYREIGKAL